MAKTTFLQDIEAAAEARVAAAEKDAIDAAAREAVAYGQALGSERERAVANEIARRILNLVGK